MPITMVDDLLSCSHALEDISSNVVKVDSLIPCLDYIPQKIHLEA